ncbi:hypothetical protein ACOMHN_035141 [Nucella lapillus]
MPTRLCPDVSSTSLEYCPANTRCRHGSVPMCPVHPWSIAQQTQDADTALSRCVQYIPRVLPSKHKMPTRLCPDVSSTSLEYCPANTRCRHGSVPMCPVHP